MGNSANGELGAPAAGFNDRSVRLGGISPDWLWRGGDGQPATKPEFDYTPAGIYVRS